MIRFKNIKHQNNHPEEHPILHFDYLKITCDKGKSFIQGRTYAYLVDQRSIRGFMKSSSIFQLQQKTHCGKRCTI